MSHRIEPSLDRKQLVAAAFALLAEDGLDRFSMRRLAARLTVQPSALYWHVGDKAELLGLMAAEIYAQADAEVPTGSDWQHWLTEFGHALRRAYLARRDGALLCAQATPGRELDPEESGARMAAALVAMGLPVEKALGLRATVIAFTLGWAVFEANGPMHDFLGHLFDFDARFEAGLEALVRGSATS